MNDTNDFWYVRYWLSKKEDKIIMILRILQEMVEEKLVTFELLLKKHFLIYLNKYLTNYGLNLYRNIFQIQYKRLEEFTRIQFSNTKESKKIYFFGKTPYFNYAEFKKIKCRHKNKRFNNMMNWKESKSLSSSGLSTYWIPDAVTEKPITYFHYKVRVKHFEEWCF